MKKFKVGDDVFLFELRGKPDKNGIRAKIERSKISEFNEDEFLLEGRICYTLANGTTSNGKNLYFIEEFQEKIAGFLAYEPTSNNN